MSALAGVDVEEARRRRVNVAQRLARLQHGPRAGCPGRLDDDGGDDDDDDDDAQAALAALVRAKMALVREEDEWLRAAYRLGAAADVQVRRMAEWAGCC